MVQISIFQGHKPELPPADVNVVIDVIRAFTTTYVAFDKGVREIVLAPDVESAFDLRTKIPDSLLAGEIKALPIPGFDFGNSPADINEAQGLKDRTLILKTTNGVEAALHAMSAPVVFVVGFINAKSTAEYLRSQSNIKHLNIIASHPTGDEDMACAEYMRDLIIGVGEVNAGRVAERIRTCQNAKKFLDGTVPQLRSDDIDYCTREIYPGRIMRVQSHPSGIAIRSVV